MNIIFDFYYEILFFLPYDLPHDISELISHHSLNYVKNALKIF